ncbi:MAG: hypothetical protein ACLSB9_11335 [Hydrogeniiclostridium mannosilyticum]
MMPTLFVCLLAVIIRSVTLPGALEGLQFMFTPSASGRLRLQPLFRQRGAGPGFYSLSLCMGITITYGSYLNKGKYPAQLLQCRRNGHLPGGAGGHCHFSGGVFLRRGCRAGAQPDLQHAAESL